MEDSRREWSTAPWWGKAVGSRLKDREVTPREEISARFKVSRNTQHTHQAHGIQRLCEQDR